MNLGWLISIHNKYLTAVPFQPVPQSQFTDIFPILRSMPVKGNALLDIGLYKGLILRLKAYIQRIPAAGEPGFDGRLLPGGNRKKAVAHGSAGTYLQAIVQAAHRRDAAGKGDDRYLPFQSPLPEQLPRPEAHFGSQGGVDAQVAVDLVCENNGTPLRFPMAFNAIADKVHDIIGIKVLWEKE
jgi:hypothetical protein